MVPSSRSSSTKHQSASRGTASRAIDCSVASKSSEPASIAPASASAPARRCAASSSVTSSKVSTATGGLAGGTIVSPDAISERVPAGVSQSTRTFVNRSPAATRRCSGVWRSIGNAPPAVSCAARLAKKMRPVTGEISSSGDGGRSSSGSYQPSPATAADRSTSINRVYFACPAIRSLLASRPSRSSRLRRRTRDRRRRRSRQPFHFVLAQVALEQPPVALLVVQDRDHHVLRHEVESVGELDDAVVVLDRAGLGLDHALDHVHDVGLVLGRLQVRLLRVELERARHDAVELLDAAGELLRVAELLLDVLLERLDDLLRAHAVGVDRVGDVAHHRLDLHPVRLLEQLDQLLALGGLVVGQDSFGGVADGHGDSFRGASPDVTPV